MRSRPRRAVRAKSGPWVITTPDTEYAKVHGVHLSDHFPLWEPCWSVWINGGSTVVKHRWANGTHAGYNNVLKSGVSFVTGHLHSLDVTPWTDYTGTRFGVRTGCLADVYARSFVDYTEDGPRNWRSGFVVLTFSGGRLLWPEIVHALDDKHVEFRGQIIRI